MRLFIAAVFMLPSLTALSQTSECNNIKSGSAPYTAVQNLSSFQINGNNRKIVNKSKIETQIYREDKSFVTAYASVDGSTPIKTILKNGVTHKIEARGEGVYSISTAQAETVLSRDPRVDRENFKYVGTLNNKRSGRTDENTSIKTESIYVRDDKIQVGQCIVNVIVYKILTSKQVLGGDLERGTGFIYFSPELRANIKTEFESLDSNNKSIGSIVSETNAISSVVDFERDRTSLRIFDDICLSSSPSLMADKMTKYKAKMQEPALNKKFFDTQEGSSWAFEFNNRKYSAGFTTKGACLFFAFDSNLFKVKDLFISEYATKLVSTQVSAQETRYFTEMNSAELPQSKKGILIIDAVNDLSSLGGRISFVPSNLMSK